METFLKMAFGLAGAVLALISGGPAAATGGPSVLVVILDGLRPDYITPELTPNLYALGERGVVFENHHAVYPTVTRVNSASISTGAYPARHGLLGNRIYIPEVEPGKALNTSDVRNLMRVAEATSGNLLTVPPLAAILDRAGMKLLAVSSGSSGSAFLLNHRVLGGGIIHSGLILPESQRKHVLDVLGPIPEDAAPNAGRNAWAVDAYLKIGLTEIHPRVTFMWLSDPDHTAHEAGIGAPKTIEALSLVDGLIGRIVAAHDSLNLRDTANIVVTSDHGFSTHTGGANIAALLRKERLSDHVVVAGGAIYVLNHKRRKIRRIVKALQRTPWVGAVFTRAAEPGSTRGHIAGTLSFDAIHWNHARSADILVSPNWTDEENEYGYRGATTNGGVAGHGSTSPFDIHNTLIAAGPAFRRGLRSALPTANVDIAPTLCRILGLPVPATMDGRVLEEALVGSATPGNLEVTRRIHTAETAGYRLELQESQVAGRRYFDSTRVER